MLCNIWKVKHLMTFIYFAGFLSLVKHSIQRVERMCLDSVPFFFFLICVYNFSVLLSHSAERKSLSVSLRHVIGNCSKHLSVPLIVK